MLGKAMSLPAKISTAVLGYNYTIFNVVFVCSVDYNFNTLGE
jgi:hypothetical protein